MLPKPPLSYPVPQRQTQRVTVSHRHESAAGETGKIVPCYHSQFPNISQQSINQRQHFCSMPLSRLLSCRALRRSEHEPLQLHTARVIIIFLNLSLPPFSPPPRPLARASARVCNFGFRSGLPSPPYVPRLLETLTYVSRNKHKKKNGHHETETHTKKYSKRRFTLACAKTARTFVQPFSPVQRYQSYARLPVTQ